MNIGKMAKLAVARLKVEEQKANKKSPASGLGGRVSPQTPTTGRMSSPRNRVANYVAKIRAMRTRGMA